MHSTNLKQMVGGLILMLLMPAPVLTNSKSVDLATDLPRISESQLDIRDSTAAQCSLTSKALFTLGEPIILMFEVVNPFATPATLNLGYAREGGFMFTLELPDGSGIQLPRRRFRGEGPVLMSRFSLKSQEVYTQQLILNDWYEFKQPGRYRLISTILSSKAKRSNTNITCEDLVLEFEIGPSDVQSLENVCAELLESIRQNISNFGKASDAAHALANVRNPAAVPFLEKAIIVNPAIDSFMITGLEAIGDTQAIRVLISMLSRNERNSSQFAQARAALVEIEKRPQSAEGLELIKKALARYPPPIGR